jgi:ketosteroid isomerase-like protein
MSRANVELVRRAFLAAIRRPKPDVATVNALYHPHHELVTPLSRLEGTTFRGMSGFRAWLTTRGEDWDSLKFRLERVEELDDDRVLVACSFIGTGRRGGVPIQQVQGLVVTVQGGKVARTEAYSTVEDALEAVGLRE